MQSVYRYRLQLAAEQVVSLPLGARVLCIQYRADTEDSVDMWAQVTPENETADVTVWLIGTGHAEVPRPPARYVGTVQLDGGAYVFHGYVVGA